MQRLILGLRLAAIGAHLASGVLQAVALFPFGSHRWRRELKRRWSHRFVALLGLRVDAAPGALAGIEHGLLVANHVSFIDILVINSVLPCSFVAKSEVAGWPLIGWLATKAETLYIRRGSRRAAHETHRGMVDALASGRRLAIFPEGTTTAGDHVLPFHSALFQSAIDVAAPVHALAMSYHDGSGARSTAPAYIDELTLMQCLVAVLQSGGLTVRLVVAARFDPPLPDRRHLAHRAHQAIAGALAKAIGQPHRPAATPPDRPNKGGFPQTPAAQPSRNEAAMTR